MECQNMIARDATLHEHDFTRREKSRERMTMTTNRRQKTTLKWTVDRRYEDDGASDDFITGIIILSIICGFVALGGFSCLTVKTIVETNGTITSVSYSDAVDRGTWHRVYEIVIDNVTMVMIDDVIYEGLHSNTTAARNVGDHVSLIHGEWMSMKISGPFLIIYGNLDDFMTSDTSFASVGQIVGWIAVAIPTTIIVLRIIAWACQFKIEVERFPKADHDRVEHFQEKGYPRNTRKNRRVG
jgi:hypothetical protein